jgi:uncharacterized protein (DUF2252 family)
VSNRCEAVRPARHLLPFLGKRMLSGQVSGCSVFLRELLPQDFKVEMDRVSVQHAVAAARYMSSVLGKAHARQMDEKVRAQWCLELARNRSKSLDAPSWLWRSVVDFDRQSRGGIS